MINAIQRAVVVETPEGANSSWRRSKEIRFMLNIMRKNASSLLIKILLGIIVIVLSLFGLNTIQKSRTSRVALVNGEPISVDTYQYAYNNYVENLKSQYGSNLSQDVLKMFQVKRTVVNSLVSRALMLQEAERLNIRVTNEELATEIHSMDVFQNEGIFNEELYDYVLKRNDLTQKAFEVDMRETMLISKLNAFITSGIKVTEGEILEWYDWINASVDIDYVLFDPNSISGIEPTDEELSSFYEINKENYRTEPLVKVRYMAFRPDNYTDTVNIEDEDILDYYDMNKSEFETEKTVEARHILLMVDEDATEDVVEEKRKKAEEIMEMAKSGKDFAELAKEYSEGTTRETGGLLGEFKKGDMVAPFSEAAFSMAEGDISEPVRTQFGWHVIKVEKVNEASVSSLEDVSDQIRKKLTKEFSQEIAYDMADEAYDQAMKDDDFEKTASDLGIQLQETGYIGQDGTGADTSDPVIFAEAAFELNGAEISYVLNIGDSFYLLQKTGEIPSDIPKLADVREQVISDVVKKMQDEQARKDAEEFLATAKAAGGIESASKEPAIDVKSSGFFKRSDSIPDLGYESEINQAAFLLSDGDKIADKVFKGSAGYYVVQLKDRKIPDPDELNDQKDTIRTQLISQKKQIVFKNWIDKLEDESEITFEEGYQD